MVWMHWLKVVRVLCWDQGVVTQQSRKGEEWEWVKWVWTIEKPSSQVEPWYLLSLLPRGLLCWDLWRAESPCQPNHWMLAGEDPVSTWACVCFMAWWIWELPFPFRGLQSAPNVSHYSVWKTSYSFRFFTSSYIRGNPIFHISFCFVDVIVRDAGSHATGLLWLWSAWPQLIVNGEQMKEIFTNFMGIQAGPKPSLMLPFTVNVYWTLWLYCALQYLYSIRF